jgi:hypothetical protein
MNSQIILDVPTAIQTPAIDPLMLAQLNSAWWNNAMQLGYFCLVVGFAIGFASAYIYQKRKYGDI